MVEVLVLAEQVSCWIPELGFEPRVSSVQAEIMAIADHVAISPGPLGQPYEVILRLLVGVVELPGMDLWEVAKELPEAKGREKGRLLP